MRLILVFALLLLGLASAAPEPEYTLLLGDKLHAGNSIGALVEIESSVGRTDRLSLSLAALQPRILRVEVLRPEDGYALKLASASADLDIPISVTAQANNGGQASLDDLCNALYTSAQNNDLPVPFFANLIWQESRLRADDVSKKGAQGIAQFMPEAAVETGLADPFDPMQAIPASARLLQKLRLQFGNLGFVAAAYNAGPHRVAEWLEHRASLPRETRGYVVSVTGLSVETWRSMPIDNDTLTFVQRLPCRRLPAFANVEQEQMLQMQQMQQTRLDHANGGLGKFEEADDETATVGSAVHPARKHASERHEHARDEARRVTHDHHPVKREAAHAPHGAREKHKSA
jgi:Transglycosylase SLT domain